MGRIGKEKRDRQKTVRYIVKYHRIKAQVITLIVSVYIQRAFRLYYASVCCFECVVVV